MEKDILGDDIAKALKQAENIQSIIDKIYYSDELSLFFRRPFITMVSTAADFIVSNLKIMLVSYKASQEKKES